MKKMFSTNGSLRPLIPMMMCLLLVEVCGEVVSFLGVDPVDAFVPVAVVEVLVMLMIQKAGYLGWLDDWNIWV